MAIYSATVAAPAAFTDYDAPSFTIPFQPKTVALINEDGTLANYVEVSFDGANVHAKLIPTILQGLKVSQNSTKIWIRGVGSAVLRIVAED